MKRKPRSLPPAVADLPRRRRCNVDRQCNMPWVDVQGLVIADEPTQREKEQVTEFVRRKAKPRFYADENFPILATTILRRRKADVLTVQDTRRKRHPDENHAAEALRLRRVLITCDRDYLDERRFPLVHCPALVVCNFSRGTAQEIFDTFDCLTGIFRAPQFYDKWMKIDARRDSWTEYARHLDGTTSRTRYRFHNRRMQEWVDATNGT
jgi:aspartyl/asparaginyl-tRNA synthetase